MKNACIIKENRIFRFIYRKGKPFAAKEIVIYSCKNKGKGIFYGITAGKKVGNAVLRNRSKRIIRAAFSQIEERLIGNWSFIFVARSKTPTLKSTDLVPILEDYFKSIGALKPDLHQN